MGAVAAKEGSVKVRRSSVASILREAYQLYGLDPWSRRAVKRFLRGRGPVAGRRRRVAGTSQIAG
jgi:hypothetical protein